MKKISFLISGIFMTAFISAQPVLSTFPALIDGKVQTSRSMAYTGPDMSDYSGAHVTWDFSAQDFSSATEHSSTLHTDMINAPHAADFPTATFYNTSEENDELFEGYGQFTSNSYIYLGYTIQDQVTVYNDPLVVYSIPFQYSETQSDTYGFLYDNGSSHVTANFDLSTVFDGYGTLILPYGTFTDIIRLKITTHGVMSYTSDAPEYSSSIIMDDVEYVWFDPVSGISYLNIITTNQIRDGVPLPSSSAISLSMNPTVTGLLKNTTGREVVVFPQPAIDQVKVAQEGLHGECLTRIYDLNGEEVRREDHIAVAGSLSLDLKELTTGIYILELQNEDRVSRCKLIVK